MKSKLLLILLVCSLLILPTVQAAETDWSGWWQFDTATSDTDDGTGDGDIEEADETPGFITLTLLIALAAILIKRK